MSDVIKDVAKHVSNPLMKFQKKLRKKAARLIDPNNSNSNSNSNRSLNSGGTNTSIAAAAAAASNSNSNSNDAQHQQQQQKQHEHQHQHALYAIRHWDASVNKIKIHHNLFHRINPFGGSKKRRRITIELYKKTTPEQKAYDADRERRMFKKLYARASFGVGSSSNASVGSNASSTSGVSNSNSNSNININSNSNSNKDEYYDDDKDENDDNDDDDLTSLEDDDLVIVRVLKPARPKPKRPRDHAMGGGASTADSWSQYSRSQSDDSYECDYEYDCEYEYDCGDCHSEDDSRCSSQSSLQQLKNGDLGARFLTTYNANDYGDDLGQPQPPHDVAARWKERYRARLECVRVVNNNDDDNNDDDNDCTPYHNNTVRLQLAPGVLRDVCFDTVHQMETFLKTLAKMNELQHERGSRRMAEVRVAGGGGGDRSSGSNHAADRNNPNNPSSPTNNSGNTLPNPWFWRIPLLPKIPENDNDHDHDDSQYSASTIAETTATNTNTNTNTNNAKGGGIWDAIFGKNNNNNNNNNTAAAATTSDGSGHETSNNKKPTVSQQSVNLLVEIVSATNLPIADISSSDPFVIVEDGQKEWHRTDVISKSLNPVWTLSTGSLFLIQTTVKEFFANGADQVEFTIRDYDSVGENDVLGSVSVHKADMLNGKGERVEHPILTGSSRLLTASSSSTRGKKSFLSLRCRTATPDEISFLQTFETKKKNSGVFGSIGRSSRLTGVFAKDCHLPPQVHPAKLMKKQKRKANDGSKTTQYRLKPSADPSRPEQETKWLTKRQIERESKQPSQKWIEAGSGTAGKFYVEIIGCDGLPNLDFGFGGRNKSDPFVCIAFEDCVVNTDVINDCLSPRWMPWTQRAFVFNVMHPSSQFYIAAMDYDEVVPGNPSPCDTLGRCIVNPTNARPNTLYTMRMSLFTSDDTDRKITGKIVVRIRYESSDERRLLLSAFQFRNRYDVSTSRKTDFATTKYALTNDYDHNSLSLETIQKYVDELLEYLDVFDDIVDAITSVILWRGHFPLELSFCKKKKYTYAFKAPLHSMIAFVWAILLSNNFNRIIAFICFAPAWCLLGTLESRRANPNPWKRPRTYIELLGILLFNKSYARHRIKENENVEEIIQYDERRRELMKFRKDAIETVRIQNEIDAKHLEQENKELDKQAHDTSAQNKTIGFNQIILAPFKDILMPVQLLLYQSVVISRVATSIVCWYDSVASFWIVTIALVLCFAAFFIPWAFLFHWTFAIVACTFLGPWMKLVDIFFIDNVNNMTYVERKAKVEADYKKRYDYILGESKIIRLHKENSMKLRDMERYMFGQFVARFPIFKEERFHSIPLSGGSAVPILDPSTLPPVNIVRRINGQRLQGEMIPKREKKAKEFKEAKRRETAHSNSRFTNNDTKSQVPAVISTESALTRDEKSLLRAPLLGEEDRAGDDDDGNHNHTGDESPSSRALNLNDAATNYGTMEDMVPEKAGHILNELAFDIVL